MPPVIIAKDLNKCYPGSPPVLRGVNISVEPGEIVAIMGPSGCGKSTMLHVLGMLHTPDSGTLEVLNTNVLTLNREQTAAFRRGNMGFVMQSCNLFDHSTVFENVEFPLIYEGIPPEERWERVIRALDLVRLSARVHYRSNRLSGGEQQRVAIARAMVNNPRILLADEPTGALDFRTSRAVMENFRSLAHEGGVAMVVVTHDNNVATYCDTVYTLEDGVLVCQKKEALPEIPPLAADSSILSGPRRKMNAACIAGLFPVATGINAVQDMLKLYAHGVLAKAYSTHGTNPFSFDADQFGLPVAVRRMGWSALPAAGMSLLRHLRSNSSLVWRMWSKLPFRKKYSLSAFMTRLRNFSCGTMLAQWLHSDAIEHLHALGAHGPSTAAWVASGISGIPFSFSIGTADMQRRNPGLPIKAESACFIRCDTEETLNLARQACPQVPAEKFVLLRPGLTFPLPEGTEQPEDSKKSLAQTPILNTPLAPEDLLKPLQPPHGGLRLLVAGHLCQRKGYGVLLQACASLKKDGIPFYLQIAGSGSMLWPLRFKSLCLGLGKQVSFCGSVPHERMRQMFQEASIFVAPGIVTSGGQHDGLPTAVVEAMQYGLTIVASKLPAHEEVLTHGKNALLVEPGSPDALAAALTTLGKDYDLARALGDTAKTDALNIFEHEESPSALAQYILKFKNSK